MTTRPEGPRRRTDRVLEMPCPLCQPPGTMLKLVVEPPEPDVYPVKATLAELTGCRHAEAYFYPYTAPRMSVVDLHVMDKAIARCLEVDAIMAFSDRMGGKHEAE